MSRTSLVLSAAVLFCASSQIAFADENGLVTGAVGGAVAGAVVGGPVGAVVGGVGGAAIGNSVTNHRSYHGGYAYHPYHHHYYHHYDQYWSIDAPVCEGAVGVRIGRVGFYRGARRWVMGRSSCERDSNWNEHGALRLNSGAATSPRSGTNP
jgi:hypothetical protein